jgi:hypothetical protein
MTGAMVYSRQGRAKMIGDGASALSVPLRQSYLSIGRSAFTPGARFDEASLSRSAIPHGTRRGRRTYMFLNAAMIRFHASNMRIAPIASKAPSGFRRSNEEKADIKRSLKTV